jgi:hypothetical protein
MFLGLIWEENIFSAQPVKALQLPAQQHRAAAEVAELIKEESETLSRVRRSRHAH